ncbi:MAG: DUF2793 domain-containing protein [Jannaschia sp.]
MSDNTVILSLPLIQASQAQKHVTHNEAIRRLDALVQPVVLDIDRTDAPVSPDEGDRHIVAAGAAGEWLGQDGRIAVREGNAWTFIPPAAGWRVHVLSLGADVVLSGDTWTQPTVQSDTLGINADADAVNRLTVRAAATLLTHEGAGHQVKINKAAATDTASLLFQTGFSGRAEMGTSGSDGFAVKTSADGVTWREAMNVAAGTGVPSFPSGVRVPGRVGISGRWTCQTDNRWVTFDRTTGPSNQTFGEACGTGAEPTLDWTQMGPVLRAGTTITGFSGLFRNATSAITGFDLRVAFQHAGTTPPWDTNARTIRTILHSANGIALATGWTRLGVNVTPFTAPQDGFLIVYLRPLGTLTALNYIHSSMTVTYLSSPSPLV